MKRKHNHQRTRKMYEQYLNEVYPVYTDNMEYLLTHTKRPALMRTQLESGKYGSLLRKHDPIAFNVGYNEWERR